MQDSAIHSVLNRTLNIFLWTLLASRTVWAGTSFIEKGKVDHPHSTEEVTYSTLYFDWENHKIRIAVEEKDDPEDLKEEDEKIEILHVFLNDEIPSNDYADSYHVTEDGAEAADYHSGLLSFNENYLKKKRLALEDEVLKSPFDMARAKTLIDSYLTDRDRIEAQWRTYRDLIDRHPQEAQKSLVKVQSFAERISCYIWPNYARRNLFKHSPEIKELFDSAGLR